MVEAVGASPCGQASRDVYKRQAEDLADDYMRFYNAWTGKTMTREEAIRDIKDHPVYALDQQLDMFKQSYGTSELREWLHDIVSFQNESGELDPVSYTHLAIGLPAPFLHTLFWRDGRDFQSGHGFAEIAGDFGKNLVIIVVGHGCDNGLGAFGRICGLEDAGAHEHAIKAELHHESGVGGRGDAPSEMCIRDRPCPDWKSRPSRPNSVCRNGAGKPMAATSAPRIGVLAIQGAFREHVRSLCLCGAETVEIRTREDLEGLSGLVFPGGESTVMGLSLIHICSFLRNKRSRDPFSRILRGSSWHF